MFKSIRFKILAVFALLILPFFVLGYVLIDMERRETAVVNEAFRESNSILKCAQEASMSAVIGGLHVQRAFYINSAEELQALNELMKLFDEKRNRFEIFIRALTWGTENEIFKKTGDGRIYAAWLAEGWDKTITLRKVSPEMQQLAGQASIYYRAFAKYANQTVDLIRKSIQSELDQRPDEAKEWHLQANKNAQKSYHYQGLVNESLKHLINNAEENTKKIRNQIRESQDQRIRKSTQIGFLVFLFSILFGYVFLSKNFVKPLEELTRDVHALGKGNPDGIRVTITGKDEIGQLAKSFNSMIDDLKKTTVSRDSLLKEIEERKQIEEKLRRSEETVRLVLETAKDAFVSINPQGAVTYWNAQSEKVFGWTREEILGQPMVKHFIPERFRDAHQKGLERYLSTGEASILNKTIEVAALHKDGHEFPIELSIWAMRTGEDLSFNAFIRDIQERKRLEQMVKQSEKMSAIGQLAAGVAHEINNPLGVILGFSQNIARRIQPGDPFEMPLKSIEREAVRCKNLVQDLLTFSRVGKSEKESLDLKETIENALSLIQAQANVKNVTLVKELSDVPPVLANRTQIQQVIVNLCNNAVDAMPNGGQLCIRLQKEKSLDQKEIEIQIQDTGQGIPPDIQSKIFNPFFTTKEIGKGTGLGLALVHEIVQKHNGQIFLDSQVGKGTLFRVLLPVE